MANACTRCCKPIRHFPTRIVCILVFILQACVLNYYLITNNTLTLAVWAVPDAVALIMFIITFVLGYRYFTKTKHLTDPRSNVSFVYSRFGMCSWLLYACVLSAKVAYIFKDFAYKLDESTFFGPNTLKTTIALAGIVYMLFLSTLHDAKPSTSRRKYIEELTGTVIFDILDGVDSMEILFDKEARDDFLPGIDDAIIGIACINFIIPSIPLLTLAKTNFGHKKLSQKMVIAHKVLLAFMVNLPLLVTRMVVWHGMSHGISIFSLKNVIVIGVVLFDLYESHEGEEDDVNSADITNGNATKPDGGEMPSYALEDRFNYA